MKLSDMIQFSKSTSSFPILFLGLMICFISCKSKDTRSDRSNQEDLYMQSISIIEKHLKSMRNAKDSIQADSIFQAYESEITELNMGFPPGTDFSLTEDENDMIAKHIESLVQSRDSVLRKSSLDPFEPITSIAPASANSESAQTP